MPARAKIRRIAKLRLLTALVTSSGLVAGGEAAGIPSTDAATAHPSFAQKAVHGFRSMQPAPPDTRKAEKATGQWRVVKETENRLASAVLDVSASGPRDIWVAGDKGGTDDDFGSGLIERWDGSRWLRINIPGANTHYIGSINAKAANNVWLTGGGITTWAAHWNGSTWSKYHPRGNKGHGNEIQLHDVTTLGGRPWFAGTETIGSNLKNLEHHRRDAVVLSRAGNGGFTKEFSTPGSLESIATYEKTGDIWAVGSTNSAEEGTSTTSGPLVLHRKGGDTRWEAVDIPSIPGGRLTQVSQTSETDVWAVGHVSSTDPADKNRTTEKPISLHFDGKSWRQIPVPVDQGHLSGLTVDASGNVWASGVDLEHRSRVLFLRHLSGRWIVSYGPGLRIPQQSDPELRKVTRTSIARVPGSNSLWATASAGWGVHERGFVLRHG